MGGPIDTTYTRATLHDGDVIDFGEFRLKAKGSRHQPEGCRHTHVVIDAAGGTLECKDCGAHVDAFTFLVAFAERRKYVQMAERASRDKIHRLWAAVRAYRPHLRAAKALEEVWRGRKAPCCPHCNKAILPEDVADGIGTVVSAEFERARRKRDAEKG